MNTEPYGESTGSVLCRSQSGLRAALWVLLLLLFVTSTLWATPLPRELRVVLDDNYPPYIFLDSQGEAQGILVDQWRAWEQATGVPVRLIPMDWSKAQDFLRSGRADVIDTLFFTVERSKIYAYSDPYCELEVPVFFHKSLSGITDVKSLSGFSIGVKSGDAVIDILRGNGITDLREYPNYAAIINAAAQGEVKVFSIDAPPALYYLYKDHLEDDFRTAFTLYSGQFHRAVLKDRSDLLTEVERGFQHIPAKTIQDINRKWLGKPISSNPYYRYLPAVLAAGLGVVVLLGLFVFLLRRQVREKTSHLEMVLAALRRNETRYRSVVENASEVIFVAQQGRIRFITPSVEKLVGRAPEELENHDSVGIIHPDDYDAVIERHHRRLRGEDVSSRCSFRVVHKSGQVRHVSMSSSVIEWEGEVASLNVLTDISDRVEIEAALQVSETKLRKLFASMTDVILVLDREGRYVDIAPTRTDLLYRPPQDILGKTINDVFAKDVAEGFMDTIHRALQSDDPVSLDYTLTINGKDYWFAGNALRYTEDSILWIARDITERKAAEEKLRMSEERFRFILNDISNIAIQGYDEERRVIFWNEASERLYGYPESEAMQCRLEDLIIPDPMRDEVIQAVRNWVQGGTRIPAGELVLRHKDGTAIPVYSSHVMYTATNGRKEMFCIDLELGPIRRMQQELVVAKEKAEAANRAKSEFLANMSHEIRTPLNGVLGMLQLLQTTELEAEQMEYVGHAVASSKRLTRLLSDILDLSRIESNKLLIQNVLFSMSDVLEAVYGLFMIEAKNKGLELRLALDPAIPDALLGDEHRLRQILFNLVGNALKFTEKGSVEVAVSALRGIDSAHCRVLFEISDTGCGIVPEQIRGLFEPFTQAAVSYVRSHQGAGLGLAIVKRLTDLMGGSVYIESAIGEGTLILVCLEFALGYEQSDRKPVGGAGELRESLQGMRILLAEDDPVNQLAMSRMLEKGGATVLLVQDGRDAVELLQRETVDVVFMDIQMPVLDGISATKQIRASERPDVAGVPIIALTAYAMSGDRERFLDSGVDGYLPKPVKLSDILDIVHSQAVQSRLAVRNSR